MWADRRITFRQLLRNWTVVYIANLVGAAVMAPLVHWSGVLDLSGGAFGHTAGMVMENNELMLAKLR
jgi:formate/nitrite transporter FocA (FNT family)